MRIAILHPYLDKPRGAELQVAQYTRFLIERGHDVGIFTFEYQPGRFQYSHLIRGATVTEMLPRAKTAGHVIRGVKPWKVVQAGLAFTRHRKLLVGYDIINAHNHPMEWVSAFVSTPTVWTCNEPPAWEYLGFDANQWTKWLHPHLVKRIRQILVLDYQMLSILNRIPHYPRATVVGSGAELLRPVVHKDNSILDVLYVGPLHPQKRPMDVVRVCAGLRRAGHDVLLHLVGEDLTGGQLRSEVMESGVPVSMRDWVSSETLYRLYDLADLALFLPEKQPWGIFPLEAALGSVPTLVSDQCGFLSVLGNMWPFPTAPMGDVATALRLARDIVDNVDTWREKARTMQPDLAEMLSWRRVGERVEKILVRMAQPGGET